MYIAASKSTIMIIIFLTIIIINCHYYVLKDLSGSSCPLTYRCLDFSQFDTNASSPNAAPRDAAGRLFRMNVAVITSGQRQRHGGLTEICFHVVKC